jgi:serine/threonine protein kinase
VFITTYNSEDSPTTPNSDSELVAYKIMYDVVGTGNYSVVIHPAITSNLIKEFLEYSSSDYRDVSKIFKKGNETEFHNELDILLKVKNIPEYTHFTTAIKGASCFDSTNIQHQIEDIDYDNDVYQIIFEYGGIPINKMQSNISFLCFLKLFKQLLIGINKLHNKSIVHRDIKPTNCLFAENKFNLIDFGLACHVDNVYKNDDDSTKFILSYMYMYHPPEFYIVSLIHQHQNLCGGSIIDTIDEVFNTILPAQLDKFYHQHYHRYFAFEYYNAFAYHKAFANFYDNIKANNVHNLEELLTAEFVFKSDVFALSFILKSLKSHVIFDNMHQRQIYKILYNMMYALNPYERYNINDILDYIENNMYLI